MWKVSPLIRLRWLLILAFFLPSLLHAQGVQYTHKEAGDGGTAVPYPLVTVCTSGAAYTPLPCTPKASIYSDAALLTPLANPFRGDMFGNIEFYATPAAYIISVTAPYSPGYSFKMSGAGGFAGTIGDTQVAVGTGVNTIGSDGNLIWGASEEDPPRKKLTVQGGLGVLRPYNYTNALNSVWSIDFGGHQANAATATFGAIQQKVISNTNGAVTGQFDFFVEKAGVATDILTLTGTGATSPNINGIRFVDGTVYATIGAALAGCPATGVAIISTLPETFASDPFAAVTCPFDIWLIGGTSTNIWKTNVGLRIGHNGQRIRGAGPNLTEIQANSGTFPGATAVISVGAPGPSGVNGSGVYDLAIDCASVAGSIGIHLDGVQELSGTSNTQVVNCMADGYRLSSDQGAGATQNQLVLDHIRAACSVSAAAGCVPVHVTSTAGVRVVIRDVTAVTTTPTVVTDCIKSDSTNATTMLEDAHVEECTNGFHYTAAGGQFEVDGMTGSTTTTTLVRNDSNAASYQLRNLNLNSSTNALVDAGRTITTAAPFCSAAGVSSVYITCGDTAVAWQISSDLVITPPIGAGAGIKEQLLAGFTAATPALVVFDNSANTQLNFTNDGRIQLRGNQTGAFVQTMASDTLTAGRAIQFPNGPSATTLVAALVTTAAATDNVTIQGMTASGHCSLTPTNAAAIGAATPPGVTTKTANQITVTHAVTANMNYDVMCTSN